jgi:acetyl esterase/lipase
VFDDKTKYAVGKAARPILINIWYPARKVERAKPMLHREYLAIETDDSRLSRFATQLANYERFVVCDEVWRQPPAKLSEIQRRAFDRFWDTPTASRRNAPAADGKFPIVIYHSGARSSYEDNATLFEFLASHGYIVVDSAFQDASGRTLNIDGREGSLRDIEFLIAYASRLPHADWNHVGLAGHSAGAHAALVFRSQSACAVDAVVSLDTWTDYMSSATRDWDESIKPMLANAKNTRGRMLFAARANAVFEFADRLKYAERYYLTVNKLDHNDFISQGIIRHLLESWAKPDNADVRRELEQARASYTAICEYVLTFFDAYLKGDSSQRARLVKPSAKNPLGSLKPHVDHMRVGATAAPAFRDAPLAIPTPRQIRNVLAERGATATVSLLKRCHKHEPTAPVFYSELGFFLVDELLEKRRDKDAAAIYRFYGSLDPPFLNIYERAADLRRRYHQDAAARESYMKALRLDPQNKGAAAGLKALKDRQEK